MGDQIGHGLTNCQRLERPHWASQRASISDLAAAFRVKGCLLQHCCRDLRRAGCVLKVVFRRQAHDTAGPSGPAVAGAFHRRNSSRQLRPCFLLALARKDFFLFTTFLLAGKDT